MAQPRSADLRPNGLLTGMAVRYAQQRVDLQVPGIVTVQKRSDLYRVWNRGDTLRGEMAQRAPGAPAPRGDQRVSTTAFYCVRYALGRALPVEKIPDYGSIQEAEQEITAYLVEQAYIRRARDFAAAFMAASLWTTNTAQTGVSSAPGSNQFLQWNDSSSTPINDILAQRTVVQRACGRAPNVFMCDPDVARALMRNSTVLDIVKYGGTASNPAVVFENALASILKVDRVFVLDAVRNTAAENATVSMSDIVSTNCAVLGYFSNELMGQSAGKIFSWDAFGGFPADVPVIKKYFDTPNDSWIYEAEMYYTPAITSNPSAVFFATAVA